MTNIKSQSWPLPNKCHHLSISFPSLHILRCHNTSNNTRNNFDRTRMARRKKSKKSIESGNCSLAVGLYCAAATLVMVCHPFTMKQFEWPFECAPIVRDLHSIHSIISNVWSCQKEVNFYFAPDWNIRKYQLRFIECFINHRCKSGHSVDNPSMAPACP